MQPLDHKLEQRMQTESFTYRSFYENLESQLTRKEIHSLATLGNDFFYLVDHLSANLFIKYSSHCELLELSLQEFLWKLQIFINRFLRAKAGSPLKIREFCRQIVLSLENSTFCDQLEQELQEEYQQYFFISEIETSHLV